MTRRWTREDVKRIWKACSRFWDVFLAHVLLSQLLYFFPKYGPYQEFTGAILNGHLGTVICLVLMAPLLFSLVRITTIFDDPLRQKLFVCHPQPPRFREKLVFLVRQRQFWVEIAVFAALLLLLPLKWTYAVLLDVCLQGNPTFGGKLLLLLALFPLFFLLNIAARLSAMKYWNAYRQKKAAIYYKNEKPQKTYRRSLTPILIAYGLGGIGLGMLIPFFLGYLPFLLGVLTSKVMLVIVALILLEEGIRYGRALAKRRVFVKRLARVCAEKGYELSKLHCPYRSVFAIYAEESFALSNGDKRYSCKLISGTQKSVPLVLRPDGVCEFLHIFRLARVEVYRHVKAYEFAWEAEGKKFLILNPVPRKVCDSRMNQLDNGDVVGEYKIFTGTAFLNALERDCVER